MINLFFYHIFLIKKMSLFEPLGNPSIQAIIDTLNFDNLRAIESTPSETKCKYCCGGVTDIFGSYLRQDDLIYGLFESSKCIRCKDFVCNRKDCFSKKKTFGTFTKIYYCGECVFFIESRLSKYGLNSKMFSSIHSAFFASLKLDEKKYWKKQMKAFKKAFPQFPKDIILMIKDCY